MYLSTISLIYQGKSYTFIILYLDHLYSFILYVTPAIFSVSVIFNRYFDNGYRQPFSVAPLDKRSVQFNNYDSVISYLGHSTTQHHDYPRHKPHSLYCRYNPGRSNNMYNSLLHSGGAWSLYNGTTTWSQDLENVPCYQWPLPTLLFKLGLSDYIPVCFCLNF